MSFALRSLLRPSFCRLPVRSYSSVFVPPTPSTTAENPQDSSDVDQFLGIITDQGPPEPPSDGYPPPNPIPASISTINAKIATKPLLHLHVNATPNNTILTFTRANGTVIGWFSGGRCGFKGVNRSSYEAGYQCTVKMFEMIAKRAEEEDLTLEVVFKGFGQGRDALITALKTVEGDKIRKLVVKMSDHSPIKIGGTRAKKARRL